MLHADPSSLQNISHTDNSPGQSQYISQAHSPGKFTPPPKHPLKFCPNIPLQIGVAVSRASQAVCDFVTLCTRQLTNDRPSLNACQQNQATVHAAPQRWVGLGAAACWVSQLMGSFGSRDSGH